MYRMGVFWGGGGCYNFKYFGGWGGFLKFLFFFFGGGGWCTVDAGPEPTYEEKMRVPSPPPTPWDCRMTTTKSCRFLGGRDATVALPA